MAVYYPLFAEPFDIASEPPLHTAIIRELIDIFLQLIGLNPPSAQSVNVVTKTSHEADENHFADTVTKDNFVCRLDGTLEFFLRTARNIEQTKKTKVGIVYYDLIFRSQQSAGDVTFQYFLRDVIEEQFPNKKEAANFFGVHKSNMSRETLPYSNLIPWFNEIGYRVGHIESLYSDPDATKPTGNPLVSDHIKDLTTRELQLIKIGSTLGAIATTAPATSLASSKLKLQTMATTCANLLSEIVPVPEKPLSYHNSFFDIVKASCQAPTTSSSVGNLPDCRYLLRLEDPIPHRAKYEPKPDQISEIMKEWPLIMTDQTIKACWEKLLTDKLNSMQQAHTSTDDRSPVKSKLVKNQHAMISRAFAELQYLSVFLELVDKQENQAEAASGQKLLDKAIGEMEKHLTNMQDQLSDDNGTHFLLADLGFHEVIPRLAANYREGEFNPLDIDLYTQMLHASALNRTHSRFKDRDDRSKIIQDHQDILEALKEYRSSVKIDSLKEQRPYAIVRIVESLSRHLYMALTRETDASNQDISNVSHRSVFETIKLFSLTARSIIHQATALWTELGAKRMLFVSDYQLPREMLGGDASDDREKEINMLKFVIALAHLHERADHQKTPIPFICVVGRKKDECEKLFPIRKSTFLQQAESYYEGLPGNPAKYDLVEAFQKVKDIYFEIITKFEQNQRNSGSEKPTWTEQELHTIDKLKEPGFFHQVMTRVTVHTERSKLRSYHVPGGAVAWILGADNQIFRTSRLSQEGNIIQDIWSGDEYLIELAEICDSLSQTDPQPDKANEHQNGLVGLGDTVSQIFGCGSRDDFSYFVEFVHESRPHSSVNR
jgi:DNA-binding GntR family transcriptional regulator